MAEKGEMKAEKSEVAKKEEQILAFWHERQIFAKSLEQPAGAAPRGEFVFYDGPPFATGTPHYGHILASAIKDAVPRYQTMRGYRVARRWGWDCHGLPIENIVEKELQISGKKEIEKLGVAKFNETARSKVLTYVGEWKKTVERMGRWVDFDGSYKTMDNTYMESVWWALAELNQKGLLYEGNKVLPYCPRCETPIANSEIAMDGSYKDIADLSVYVKFELKDEPGTYLLAWTTTPWTLPGNTALAINPEMIYVQNEDNLIFAKSRLEHLPSVSQTIKKEFTGRDLVGRKYQTLFDYYLSEGQVYAADFVTTEEGTGVVHVAPAFGEDDLALARKENLPVIVHVDETGHFKPEVKDFAGLAVKPKSEDEKTRLAADIAVIKYLQEHGQFFAKQKIVHAYPHCMRCETPLYYYALPSWFIKIQDLKPRLGELNQQINWIPEHLKTGRFAKSMEGAPDWNISRNRYWATPLPIWKCEQCAQTKVVGSLKELLAEREPRNHYWVLRHGEAESNVRQIVSGRVDGEYPLTERGKQEVAAAAEKLKAEKIDAIIASPVWRTKESAELLAGIVGFPKDKIIFDDRLREVDFGDLEGESVAAYHQALPGQCEDLAEVRTRALSFLYHLDAERQGQKILLVTHQTVADFIQAAVAPAKSSFVTGELRPLDFISLPHNERFELDLHRPYVDELKLKCACGGEMKRIPEVIDCWFESGAMPFAAEHYPFENKEKTEARLPADFVAEYIAQTRTWFYYMHVLSTVLFGQIPFRNVVTTGNVLAEDGQKMSKSKGNFPDPWLVFDRYGVDALRFYLLSSPLLKAEDLSFSETGLAEVSRRVISRLRNVLAFYELYADQTAEAIIPEGRSSVLDRWIGSRLNETVGAVTEAMEGFVIEQALRPLDLLIDDLSTWYLRRSRERFKAEAAERVAAAGTLRFVLQELAKLLAPFTPFIAEEIYQTVREEAAPESVHLTRWPEGGVVEQEVLEQMGKTRELVSQGLELRAKAKIKVRQPLSSLQLGAASGQLGEEYKELIQDEVNVEKVIEGSDEFSLDVNITPELQEKGELRELIRELQDWRKAQGLAPGELTRVRVPMAKKALVEKYLTELKRATSAADFEFVD